VKIGVPHKVKDQRRLLGPERKYFMGRLRKLDNENIYS
jgi:hypothetical protein